MKTLSTIKYPAPTFSAALGIMTVTLRRLVTGNMIGEGLDLDGQRDRDRPDGMRSFSFTDVIRLKIFLWLTSPDFFDVPAARAIAMCNAAFDQIAEGVRIALGVENNEVDAATEEDACEHDDWNGPWLVFGHRYGARDGKQLSLLAKNGDGLREIGSSGHLYCAILCNLLQTVNSAKAELSRPSIENEVRALLHDDDKSED